MLWPLTVVLVANTKFTSGVLRPLHDTYSGKVFVYPKQLLYHVSVFLISTFQLQQFPGYQGGPKFTLGALLPPGRPQRKNFYTPQVLAYTIKTVKFQVRSSINVRLTESSLYNRFCIERSPKMGFWGILGQGEDIWWEPPQECNDRRPKSFGGK